ncbi:MAG: ferritin-like domain-containing protein [Bacteroidales bacterium]
MSEYHEPADELSPEARDFSRALKSLKEEVEAVDWYHQRVVTTRNQELKEILEHNRDEEIEHACMTIEWLRKNMPGWDQELRDQLFKDDNDSNNNSTSLEIGDTK